MKICLVLQYSVYHSDVIQMDPSWWSKGWFEFWNIEEEGMDCEKKVLLKKL